MQSQQSTTVIEQPSSRIKFLQNVLQNLTETGTNRYELRKLLNLADPKEAVNDR